MGSSPSARDKQNIWLCRHGNRIDFVDPSWKGNDPQLSEDGVVQARETGLRLRGEGVCHIFASPFLRAVETAHYIAEQLDLPIKIEHGVCEWLNPEWFPEAPRLIPPADMRARFHRVDETYRSVVVPQYPESSEEATTRAGKTARILADTFRSDLLIVGHGHSVSGMAWGLMGRECAVSCGLCALVKISRKDGRSTLELQGDTAHLST